MESELIFFLIVIFFAGLLRSIFGFGDALIAMPLLALFFSIKTATPIVAFSGFYISLIILVRNFKKIEFNQIRTLIIFSILGIPIGVVYLSQTYELLVKTILAIVILIFSFFNLFTLSDFRLRSNKYAPVFGILSGILGGAYNTNGPPIIIYGTLKGWTPEQFRAILQGIFLPTNLFIIASHGIAGLWTPIVFNYFIYSLPVLTIAYLVGRKLHKMIPADKFTKIVYPVSYTHLTLPTIYSV